MVMGVMPPVMARTLMVPTALMVPAAMPVPTRVTGSVAIMAVTVPLRATLDQAEAGCAGLVRGPCRTDARDGAHLRRCGR